MNTFNSGERVEVIASEVHYIVGQQGTVRSVSRDLVFVVLDRQADLPNGVVLIDYLEDEARITTAFRPGELRPLIPSAHGITEDLTCDNYNCKVN